MYHMKSKINEIMDSMGFKARDKLTRFEGVVVACTFNVPGFVHIKLREQLKNGVRCDRWFDARGVEFLPEDSVEPLEDDLVF